MRRLALSLCALLALAACPKNDPEIPDTGAPEVDAGKCDRPCGTNCCEIGTSCNDATKTCDACTPNCGTTRKCGDDGCGGSCGVCGGSKQYCDGTSGVCKTCAAVLCGETCCADGQVCDAATNKCKGCTPDCTNKKCGDNGCGGSCGVCDVMNKCEANQCVACMPDPLPDLTCGLDAAGCTFGLCSSDMYCLGGKCAYCPRPLCNGTCCLEGELCNPDTLACETCQPKCAGKTCGDDGCGGQCKPGCALNQACGAAGTCSTCTSACGTRKCGADKDGCVCGGCTGNDTCIQGLCQTCSRPLCNGVCCEAGSRCDAATSRCQRCVPECSGKVCGDDNCGGLCGSCDPGMHCVAGACATCTPDCSGGKDCGPDGCGGTCGTAACDPQQGKFCIDGKCTACTQEQDAEFCARLQAECGKPVAMDNCDVNYRTTTNDCGPACGAGTQCDPATFKCVVPCSPETDQQMCTRLGRNCGSASGANNCGTVKFVADCGTCTTGKTCVSGKCQ